MAKIKAHPRVVNPKKDPQRKPQQQPRRRPNHHQLAAASRTAKGHPYSSSSASESESTFADDMSTKNSSNNQMDILARMGGSSSGKRTKQSGTTTSSRGQSGSNSSRIRVASRRQHKKQPFSVLMGLNGNEPQWVKSRSQQQTQQQPIRARPPKKGVDDLLRAGSLMNRRSAVSDNSSDDHRTKKPTMAVVRQQRRLPKANYGSSSSVLVGATADTRHNDDDEYLGQESVLVQRPKSQGHVLRRAYAAVGKEMRHTNKRRGGNQHGSDEQLVCGLISMFGVPETKIESKDRLLTRSDMPSKTRNRKIEEHNGTKPILSVLEAAVAEEKNANMDRMLERPRTTEAKKSLMAFKKKESNLKGVSSIFQECGNDGIALSMMGNELNISAEHSWRTTNDAKCLSMLALGAASPHVNETITPMRMDVDPAPSPLQNSDQMDLLKCLDRCHIDDGNYASSRKRIEEASPEMKVHQKRHDRKKTPGKGIMDQSVTIDHTQPSSCVPEKSQLPMREEKPADNVTKGQKSTYGFFADVEESLSELSDDEFFADLEHQCSPSLPDQHQSDPGATDLESFGYDKPARRAFVCSCIQSSDKVKSKIEGTALKSRTPSETGIARFSSNNGLTDQSATTSGVCFKSPQPKDSSPSFSLQGRSNSLTAESGQNDFFDATGFTEHSILKNDLTSSKGQIFETMHSSLEVQREGLAKNTSRDVSLCEAPPASPVLIDSESPAKVLPAGSETRGPSAFAARRSRRQRIATDRFTIAEHTTRGYYVAPRQSLKESQENNHRAEKQSTIEPISNENKYADDCSEGDSSEIIFCDGTALSKKSEENVLNRNVDDGNRHLSPKIGNSPCFQGSLVFSSKATTLQQRRSRRERKRTDFFHQLWPVESTERNREPTAEVEIVDTDMKSIESSSKDRSPQPDVFKTNLRSRRERKQTAFYYDTCKLNGSVDLDENETEMSADGRSMSTKGDAVEDVAAFPSHQGPRRVRRFPGRKPLLVLRNSSNASPSDNDWSVEEMAQLSAAMAAVNPTSELFWYSVACLVGNRTESECRAKWFSIAKTPMPKHSKKAVLQSNEPVCGGDEDDIFNSSPMRGFLQSGIKHKSENRDATELLCHYFGSAMKVKGGTSTPAVEVVAAKPIVFRPKAGYKTYLQNLRRDVSRAEKTVPARKAMAKTTGPSAISESVFEDDVDVNVRLSPGGTLKIKSQYEGEGDDDFWGDDYDAEAEDE